jgi:hypothetical protein
VELSGVWTQYRDYTVSPSAGESRATCVRLYSAAHTTLLYLTTGVTDVYLYWCIYWCIYWCPGVLVYILVPWCIGVYTGALVYILVEISPYSRPLMAALDTQGRGCERVLRTVYTRTRDHCHHSASSAGLPYWGAPLPSLGLGPILATGCWGAPCPALAGVLEETA